MAYRDLARRTHLYKVLKDKPFNIAKTLKYDGYQKELVSTIYKFFGKKTSGGVIARPKNEELAVELHKPIIKKIKKVKVYSSFKDNICGADLADMHSVSKFNKGLDFCYMLSMFVFL